MTSEDAALELQTMDALRGTQDLVDRLTLALSSGAPSISDLAYAIKLRVKEDFSVVSKVRKKRDQRPDYAVCDLRDVVGLRIVTLYRLDALQIIPLVLDMINGSGDTGPFEAGSLEEVRIYVTNPAGDAQSLADKLKRTFANNGYRGEPAVEGNERNYTSIHMVAWGLGKYQDEYRRIPVEIQIRTAFEDVWGEIEHKLKYKRKAIDLREGSDEADRLDHGLAHLNVLKTMIDGIAQYADQIKIQLEAGEETIVRTSFTLAVEEPLTRLKNANDLPAEVQSDIQKAFALARPMFESGPTTSVVAKVRQLSAALAEFRSIRARLQTLSLKPRTAREARFVVDMQIALVLSEIGQAAPGNRAALKESASVYADLEEVFPKRLVVLYRHAKVLDALGMIEPAITRLRDVINRFDAPGEPTPKHHWLRAAAPRVLGVILWEEATRIAQRGLVGDGHVKTRRLELLNEAYAVTREAYEQRVNADPFQSAARPSERAKAANNLLYYALELAEVVEAEGDADKLRDAVLGYLVDMNATNPAKVEDPRFLDTAMRAYLHLGDERKAREAARRFLDIIEPLSGAEWPRTPHTEAIEDLARRLVEGRDTEGA